MSSVFYGKVVPDIADFYDQPDTTQQHPGHLIEVHEKDGALTLFVYEGATSETQNQAAFFNAVEAEELVRDLEKAIRRARSKGSQRPKRVRDSM